MAMCPGGSCAELAANSKCTPESDITCASCPDGRSGQACDRVGAKFTLDANYDDFTDADGEAFASQMAAILGVDPSEGMCWSCAM